MSTSSLPGDASNDPTDDQTGRFRVQPNGRVRPLSPHLQIWRWHVTMLASILNRLTGGALSVGSVLVALWLLALAFGPDAYATFSGWMGSPPGLLVWFGLTVALCLHLMGGLRHLIWDAGSGLTPERPTPCPGSRSSAAPSSPWPSGSCCSLREGSRCEG